MKKFLSLVAVSSLFASSIALADGIDGAGESARGEKSGLFVGATSGVALNIYWMEFGTELKTMIKLGPNFGLKAGYQHFFIPLFGMRTYLDYDFYYGGEGFTNFEGIGTSRHNITLNLDLLLNFVNTNNFTFGVYIGFGLGYSVYSLHNLSIHSDFNDKFKQIEKNSNNLNGFNIPMNIGVTTTFMEHHKIELGAKILGLETLGEPRYLLFTIDNNPTEYLFVDDPYLISIGYSYIF